MTKIVESIRAQLAGDWIPAIYQAKVRTQRTRSFHLNIGAKESDPEILHTLLGVELKVGNQRFACPELPTARYIRVFARIGCSDFAIPYDISTISLIADELDTAWHRTLLLLGKEVQGMQPISVGRIRSSLIRQIRNEIREIGAGELMPSFDRETKQRKK